MATVREIMQRKGRMRKFARSHNISIPWVAYTVMWGHWGGREEYLLKEIQKALHFPVTGLWGPKEQHWFFPPALSLRYRPLSFIASLPARNQRKAMIFHTNAGGSNVFGYWQGQYNTKGSRICSHFQVFKDGKVEQYVPTTKQAFAAYASNSFAIQVETEDDGRPEDPWTDAQLKSIIALCKKYNIPGKLLQVGASDGVGWHCQYKAWNLSNHSCPCPAKIAQIHDIVLKAL